MFAVGGNSSASMPIHHSVDIRCRTEHDKISELHFTSVTFLFGANSRRMLLTCPILPPRLAFYEVKWDKTVENIFDLSHFAHSPLF